ncbi:HAMP domain-containing histidine kinase [Stenotrophomonas sp. S48]|uniref:HAMP domain-containing sensor histidine kinase n=1 Tax=unclassified Stenotrophomonas TaxID=196198 RepID=UPI0018FF1411|nr:MULTISPECIES: HAMP domain-containing sensor histidine kinase [unclassified Stenotrophomonas]MBK0024829.1 HAMP domain-containing histidine kinase [Stenotrophomonas sp. S48]MBK0047764.1 HAMP domain-containing histidine kinase [Stenotrophomonas sp. S49]
MNTVARRLPWPRTLSARLLLLLLGGLTLAHALSFGLLFFERYQATRSMMLRNLDEDVAVSVALLEHLPASERTAWVPRLERRTYRYLLRPAAAGPALETERARQVTAIIDDSLEHRYPLQARQVARLPERFEVELKLHDGTPLTIEVTPSGLPLARWLPAVLLLQLALLLACAWLAVRLAMKPLARLSQAVEQLQPGSDAAPLAEDGPAEVGAAAAALNGLQTRIRGHVSERLQILAAISHDLQTPITRMKLRVETLPEDATQQRLLDDLDHLGQLVREGVAYARSSHVASGAPVAMDLGAFLASVVGDYEDMGKPVTGGAPAGLTVQTWPQPLRRVVGNLVDNAVRYAGSAEIEAGRDAAGKVWIAVSDRGPGIPEAELQAVLAPFHRLEQSRNRDTGGTGLGLAIAVQLAQSLGGSLQLRNRDGGGLQALLQLPG